MEDHPSILNNSSSNNNNNSNSSSISSDFHAFRFNSNANITTMNLISTSDHPHPNPNPNAAVSAQPHHLLSASTSFAIAPFHSAGQHHHHQSASERHLRSWDSTMAKLQTKPTVNLLSQQQQPSYLSSELQLIPNSALDAGNLIPSAVAPATTYDSLTNFGNSGSRGLLLDSHRVKFGYRAGAGSGSSVNDGDGAADGSNLVSSNEEQQQLGCTTSNLLGLGVSELGSCAGFSTITNNNSNAQGLPTTTTLHSSSEPRGGTRFDGTRSDHHHQHNQDHHHHQNNNQYTSVDMEILKVCQQQPPPPQYAGGGGPSSSLNTLSLYDSDSCYVLSNSGGIASAVDANAGHALTTRAAGASWPASAAQELLLLPRIEGGGGASASPANPLHFFDTMPPPPTQPAASSLYRSSLHDKINVLNVQQVHRSTQPPATYSASSPFSLLKQQYGATAGRHGEPTANAAACVNALQGLPNLSPAYNTGLQSPPGAQALAAAGHHLAGHHDLSLFLQSPQQRQINLNAVLDTKLITSRTGSQTTILRNSKYLKPAQQLLNEFCTVQQLQNRENHMNHKRSRSQLMMQDAWSDTMELDGSTAAANNNNNAATNNSNLLQGCSNRQSTDQLMKTKTGLFPEIIRSGSPKSYNSSAELDLHDQYHSCRSASLLGLQGLRDYNNNNASDSGNVNTNMQEQHPMSRQAGAGGSGGGGGANVLQELMAVPASCGVASTVVTADQNSSISSAARPRQLSAEERCHLQMRKVRLIGLVEELDRRYQQYRDHMQLITTSFESAMGLGAAAPYTSVRRKEVSRQFRGLRDAIGEHIRSVCTALGEDAASVPILCKGETPRLRILDQRLRHQRALHQIASLPAHHPHHHHQHAWRPQRGLPERSVSVLRAWLFEHFLHPYPKDSEKLMLARLTGLSRNQVANWFINARVRLWKPMVEEMYLEETKELEEAASSMKDNNGTQSNMDHNINSCNINAGGAGAAILSANNGDPAKLSVLSARAPTASARY